MVYDLLTQSSSFWSLVFVKIKKEKHEHFGSRLYILVHARNAHNLADPLDGTVVSHWGIALYKESTKLDASLPDDGNRAGFRNLLKNFR
jgi:hypothetical protein